MTLPPWLARLKTTLPAWIDRVTHPEGAGRFRYALDAYEPFDIDSSHMMHNVIYTTGGGRAGLPDDARKRAWIDYLLSHQRPEDGLLIDPAIERHILAAGDEPTPLERFNARLWTSRNALCTVMELGGRPRYRIQHAQVFADPDALVRFLEQELDWTLPWGSGSRTGAIVLFAHFNRLLGDAHSQAVIEAAVDWLVRKQSPTTGAWTAHDDVPLHQQINGIMKIWIQLLPITDLPIQYPQRVIDLCLEGIARDAFIAEKLEACSTFDVALVLAIALRATDHRRDEVARLARELLPRFEPMCRPDGAMSYYPDRSLDNHGGIRLAAAGAQSDVVGTSLHAHAIALLADLAGWRDELGWTPLTEWRMRLPQLVS